MGVWSSRLVMLAMDAEENLDIFDNAVMNLDWQYWGSETIKWDKLSHSGWGQIMFTAMASIRRQLPPDIFWMDCEDQQEILPV